MSFESAMQRVGELRTMLEPVKPGPVTPAAATTGAAGTAGSANFAALLQQAQAQQQMLAGVDGDDEGGDSTSSLSSMLSGGGMGSFASAGFAGGTNPLGAATSSPASGLPMLQPSPALMQQYLQQYAQAGAMPGYPSYPAYAGDTGQQIVQLATQEIGVHETGWNNGSRIHTYRTATEGAENTPGPWCAYFVSWLCQQAGTPIGPEGKGFGYVPNIEAWGKQTGRYFASGDQRPQAGDIVIFDYGHDGTADHTGVVERVDGDGRVHTIEGNTSDQVARRDYSPSQIAGYVRPT
jgi:hypothetical protein